MGNRIRLVIDPAKLRTRRLALFLEPEELAEKAGVHVATVKAAEGSRKAVHIKTVRKLAQALQCHPGDLAAPEPIEAA